MTIAQLRKLAASYGATIEVLSGIGHYGVYADLPPGKHWQANDGIGVCATSEKQEAHADLAEKMREGVCDCADPLTCEECIEESFCRAETP